MKSYIPASLISVTLFFAAMISGTDPSYSCGPGFDYEKYRVSYVDPDLLTDSLYQSFYRTILLDHQKESMFMSPSREFHQDSWPARRKQDNLDEWDRYFKGSISEQSLQDLLYRTGPDIFNATLVALQNGTRPALRASDTITYNNQRWDRADTLHITEAVRVIGQRRDVPFLRYYLYAMECSPFAEDPNPWSRKEQFGDSADAMMQDLIEKGIQLHDECSSDFLRLRYAYQIVRLARYAEDYRKALDLYDRYVESNPEKGSIRYRALGHRAGAARKLGMSARANYWFTQVFDSCEGERELALRDIRIRSEQEWQEMYALAVNDHERAMLWMAKGFKTPGLTFSYLQKIHELEPGSPLLAMAALRELHRIESFLYANMETRNWGAKTRGGFLETDYIYTDTSVIHVVTQTNQDKYWNQTNWYDHVTGYRRYVAAGHAWDTLVFIRSEKNEETEDYEEKILYTLSGRDYIRAFREYMLELAAANGIAEPALWYMIAGYVDLMDNDFERADQCLSKAEEAAGKNGNENIRQQIFLLDFMRRVKSNGRIDRNLESSIYSTLQWFRRQEEQNQHSKFRKVMAAIGQQYLQQNDVPRAVMAFNLADDAATIYQLLDIYAGEQEIQDLINLLERGPQGDYEHMLFAAGKISRTSLMDLRGTKLLREGQFREAARIFDAMPSEYFDQDADEPTYYRSYDLTGREWSSTASLFWSHTDTTYISGHNLVSGTYYPGSSQEEEAAPLKATLFNKKTFTNRILELLGEAEHNPASSDSAYFRIGNLLFNTWRWSQSDLCGGWDGTLSEYTESLASYPFNVDGVAQKIDRRDDRFRAEFGTRNLARTFYLKAMQRTKNRELAAHCAYMLDICLKRPLTNIVHHPEAKEQDRTGYDMLMSKYRDTKFSQWIMSQCSIYKYFRKQGW